MASIASAAAEARPVLCGDVGKLARHALARGRHLDETLRVIDFKSHEPLDAEAAVAFLTRGAAEQVYRAMGEAMRLLRALPDLILGIDTDGAADGDAALDDWDEPTGPASEGVPNPPKDHLTEELDVAIGLLASLCLTKPASLVVDRVAARATWETLAEHVRQCRVRVNRARRERSKWAMITEGEEGRRKTLKALRFGLLLVARIVEVSDDGGLVADSSEVALGVAVREALLGLRRDLLEITEDCGTCDDADLSMRMRDVRLVFMDLFLSPIYKELRVADRFALQGLRRRIDAWVNLETDDRDAARQLLADVRVFAAPLLCVNHRGTLKNHDRQVRDQALFALEALSGAAAPYVTDVWAHLSRVLQQLQRVRWRDEGLDRYVAAQIQEGERPGAALAAPIGELQTLLAHMVF